MLSKEYIAGFIDGEGCITISDATIKKCGSKGHQAYVTIANTHRGVIDQIKEWLENKGAKVLLYEHLRDAPYRNRQGVTSRKDYYVLTVYGNYIKKFLPDIADLLVVKKEQAEVMLDYLETMDGTNRPVGLEVSEYRNYLMGLIQWINKGKI